MLVTVASYNIHKAIGSDGRHAPDRILAVLAEIGADIVMLQEADRRFGPRTSVLPQPMIAATMGYRSVAFGSDPIGLGWHGNAALVSRRVEITAGVTLALPSLEPRGAILIETLIDGRRLRLVSMHLCLTGVLRRQQARAILAQVAGRKSPMPTLLLGDLNEWRLHKGCLIDFGRDYAMAATGPSFPAGRPVARLDRIMADRDIVVVASGSHKSALSRAASDHLPVWATVRVPPQSMVA